AIRRLLINLLNNAQKHTQEGSIHLTARRRIEDGNEWIDLEVADTGKGLSPEIAAKLGEAFALNSGVVGDRFVQGSGLGVAICRGIGTAHGGAISLRSSPGEGTCVTVRIRADLPEPVIQQRLVEIDRSVTS